MARLETSILAQTEISEIHKASIHILERTGVLVHHHQALGLLAEAGAIVDIQAKRARFPEQHEFNSRRDIRRRLLLLENQCWLTNGFHTPGPKPGR